MKHLQDEHYNNSTVILKLKSSEVIFTTIDNWAVRYRQLRLNERREHESAEWYETVKVAPVSVTRLRRISVCQYRSANQNQVLLKAVQ